MSGITDFPSTIPVPVEIDDADIEAAILATASETTLAEVSGKLDLVGSEATLANVSTEATLASILALLDARLATLENSRSPVSLPQTLDANNTQAITSSEASPGSPWVGTATQTRDMGVVGVFINAISTAALAGSYTFEFGEDGVTWPISITVPVDDFSTIRFRQLLNVGAYFRAQFEPDSPLGAETVFLTTHLARQSDPAFVVPASHEFEEQEATFGAQWSFLKLFNPQTGLSENLRPNGVGNIITADFLTEVAKGNVPGHRLVHGYGRNPDIDTAAAESIWGGGGIYTFPTAASTLSIVSSSALDTAAGTGLRTIRVYGLDASYNEITEDVTLNGAVPVITTSSFLRVNAVEGLTAGTGGGNAGTITGTHISLALIMFEMTAGDNHTQLGFYTIPANKTGYLLQMILEGGASATGSVLGTLRIRRVGGLFRVRDNFSTGGNNSVTHRYVAPYILPAQTDMIMRASVTSNNTQVQCHFDILEVDNA